ncbi:MAG: outer membrane beta-barrel protein [Mucilaginibacter sp.]
MKRSLNLIIFILVSFICKAQTRHNIAATIIDSATKQPMEFTTVAVLDVHDSSLVSYTLTDGKGAFILRNIRDDKPVRLLISHAGYVSLHHNLKFTQAPLLNLGTLTLASKTLAEVTVKGEIVPIVIKKDTIEFNAEAFKVRPNAVVQDLLKKLPGVQVDRDGTITVEGKGISKIKLDGKEFFANDPKIVSQNLDAEMVAKVQIYDDRENDPDHLLPDYQVKKIINLKFKKKFQNATFGKIKAGAGTRGRYDIDGIYNTSVNNDLQISLIGSSKNLGTTDFIGTSLMGFGPTNGIPQNTNVGININETFSKKAKLNVTYNFSNNILNNIATTNVAQFLGDTTLTRNASNKSRNSTISHNITGTFEWHPDTLSQLRYNPTFSIEQAGSNETAQGTSFNNFVPLLSKNTDANTTGNHSVAYNHNFNYYHTFRKKGESLTLNNSFNINPGHDINTSDDQLLSFTAGLTSDTLQRLANSQSRNVSTVISANYNYPLSKTLTAGIEAGNSYTNTGSSLFTYQLDPKTGLYDVFLTSQSSDLSRSLWQQDIHPQLIYRNKQININIGFIAEIQQINNRFNQNIPDLNQHFSYLFPYLSLGLGKISFNYSEDAGQPSINQLLPTTIVYNQLSSFAGNPNLRPTLMRNFSLQYNSFNPQGMYAFISARVILENNSITQESFVSAQGATFATPVNKNGRFTTYVGGTIGKQFKKQGKWKISEQMNINGSAGRNFFETNGKQGYQDTYALPVTQTVFINWNDIIEFDPSYHINPATTHYELVKYPNSTYVQQSISLPLDVIWPKRINWSVNYTHFYNPLVAQGFQRQSNLVSFSIARAFQHKDRGELRLTCYDLLNQGVSAYHFATNNTINDIQNEAIRRYFLLTYSYRFSKTK